MHATQNRQKQNGGARAALQVTVTLAGILLMSGILCLSCASAAPAEAGADPEREWLQRCEKEYKPVPLSDFRDSINHARYGYKDAVPPYDIYTPAQIVGIAENMLYLQNPDGGWGKNFDWARKYTRSELENLKSSLRTVQPVTYGKKKTERESTMDNWNIYAQIEYLSLVYAQVPDPRYAECMTKALQWMLNAQHPVSGGFTGSDVYAVTYNDDVMTGALRVLRSVSRDTNRYGFFSAEMRQKAGAAYDRGIACILNTQIRVQNPDGSSVLTAWCQQHDHDTLEPIWARTFEPASITANESAGIIGLLMDDPQPTAGMKAAVTAACEWLSRDDIKIRGKKLIKKPAEAAVLKGRYSDYENIMIDDPAASVLWARFYDLSTMQPIWCDRDRKICASFNEMSRERRNGYGYVGTWPRKILKRYPEWKNRNGC